MVQQGLEIRGFWFQKKTVQRKTVPREVYNYVLKGIFIAFFVGYWAIGTFGQLGPSDNWDNWVIGTFGQLGNWNILAIGTFSNWDLQQLGPSSKWRYLDHLRS